MVTKAPKAPKEKKPAAPPREINEAEKNGDAKPGGQNVEAMQRYITEIDRFAEMLRDQQLLIVELATHELQTKLAYDAAKAAVREAKEVEHNTVSLLLKFIQPGSIEIMPLFDRMAPADEKQQGKGSAEWRKEPISELKLSAAAARALIDADIVLVGQLQDRVLAAPETWNVELEIADGMAEAICCKLEEFIKERSK